MVWAGIVPGMAPPPPPGKTAGPAQGDVALYITLIPRRNTGGWMERRLRKAAVIEGWALCPGCRKKLARVYYGASCHGIELFCKSCRESVILELT